MDHAEVLNALISTAIESAPQMISLSMLGIMLCMSIIHRRSSLFHWSDEEANLYISELDRFLENKPGQQIPALKRFRESLERECLKAHQ